MSIVGPLRVFVYVLQLKFVVLSVSVIDWHCLQFESSHVTRELQLVFRIDYAEAVIGSGMHRVIGDDFFNKLNSIDFGPGDKFPYIKTAVLEAQVASPTNQNSVG